MPLGHPPIELVGSSQCGYLPRAKGCSEGIRGSPQLLESEIERRRSDNHRDGVEKHADYALRDGKIESRNGKKGGWLDWAIGTSKSF